MNKWVTIERVLTNSFTYDELRMDESFNYYKDEVLRKHGSDIEEQKAMEYIALMMIEDNYDEILPDNIESRIQ